MISENEYAPFYSGYIKPIIANGKYIVENLKDYQQEFDGVLRKVDKDKFNYSYKPNKWTIKEVIQHLIDAERVFAYRALCFARNEGVDLPGFNQDEYVLNSFAKERDYYFLLNEMATLRVSTAQMYLSFTEEALLRKGKASGNILSVRAIGYLLSGHQRHHLNVLRKYYL
ncbi:MAG: DinB family protein [Flavobacteriaceae bacterium]|nr:DinB family protein [Flavobacteriaceae bacterium]